MQNIEISGFKAFGKAVTLDFDAQQKSVMLYGENGSGKSSIYDALKLVFFRQKMLDEVLTIGGTQEQHRNETSDFYFAYRHRPLGDDINIRIDGMLMEEYDNRQRPCFMLDCHAAECPDNSFNLHNIAAGIMQNVIEGKDGLRKFVDDNADEIMQKCNEVLEKGFIEAFRIGIEDNDKGIYIEDPDHGLRSCVMLGNYFNEAKLHLVSLLTQLVIIRMMAGSRDMGGRALLVMDDVVTSLDASNRKFLIYYLLEEFSDLQLLVMTHNIGFNNVFFNIAKEKGLNDMWLYANLYINAGGPHLYDYTRMTTATGIKRLYESGEEGLDNIGTMIRRRFEALLLEVSKILCIGASEDASTLVNRLLSQDKPIYLRKRDGKIFIADDLVREITRLLSIKELPASKLRKEISTVIGTYSTEHSLGNLIPVIRQFREYEKLVLHELSHGYTAMPPFNQKEVEASLVLLEKMEVCVRSLRMKNAGM